ncbi:hypothetical protein D3C86_1068420 [compost metagenome]
MRNAAAVEDAPIIACHPRLIPNRQRNQHRRITMAPQGHAHAHAHMVPRPFNGYARRRPRPVVQQLRPPTHRAHRPQATREHARFRIRARRVQHAMRTTQDKRHPPDLAGQQRGHGCGGTGWCLPGDLDARRDARARGLGLFCDEAMVPVVAIR